MISLLYIGEAAVHQRVSVVASSERIATGARLAAVDEHVADEDGRLYVVVGEAATCGVCCKCVPMITRKIHCYASCI